MNSDKGFETDRLSFSLHFNLRNHKPSESWTAFYLPRKKLIRFRSTKRIRRVSGGGGGNTRILKGPLSASMNPKNFLMLRTGW